MTEQELTDELAGLRQKRLDLAAQLDKKALQLQLWDEHIALLKEILVTLQTQGEQEAELVRVIAKEGQMVVTKTTTSLGA